MFVYYKQSTHWLCRSLRQKATLKSCIWFWEVFFLLLLNVQRFFFPLHVPWFLWENFNKSLYRCLNSPEGLLKRTAGNICCMCAFNGTFWVCAFFTSLMTPTAPWILAAWPRRAGLCCPTILSVGRKLTREEGLACDTSTSAPSRASVRDLSPR